MLNTLFPPTFKIFPNGQILPEKMHTWRTKFYPYIAAIDRDGKNALNMFVDALKENHEHSWLGIQDQLARYTSTAEFTLNEVTKPDGLARRIGADFLCIMPRSIDTYKSMLEGSITTGATSSDTYDLSRGAGVPSTTTGATARDTSKPSPGAKPHSTTTYAPSSDTSKSLRGTKVASATTSASSSDTSNPSHGAEITATATGANARDTSKQSPHAKVVSITSGSASRGPSMSSPSTEVHYTITGDTSGASDPSSWAKVPIQCNDRPHIRAAHGTKPASLRYSNIGEMQGSKLYDDPLTLFPIMSKAEFEERFAQNRPTGQAVHGDEIDPKANSKYPINLPHIVSPECFAIMQTAAQSMPTNSTKSRQATQSNPAGCPTSMPARRAATQPIPQNRGFSKFFKTVRSISSPQAKTDSQRQARTVPQRSLAVLVEKATMNGKWVMVPDIYGVQKFEWLPDSKPEPLPVVVRVPKVVPPSRTLPKGPLSFLNKDPYPGVSTKFRAMPNSSSLLSSWSRFGSSLTSLITKSDGESFRSRCASRLPSRNGSSISLNFFSRSPNNSSTSFRIGSNGRNPLGITVDANEFTVSVAKSMRGPKKLRKPKPDPRLGPIKSALKSRRSEEGDELQNVPIAPPTRPAPPTPIILAPKCPSRLDGVNLTIDAVRRPISPARLELIGKPLERKVTLNSLISAENVSVPLALPPNFNSGKSSIFHVNMTHLSSAGFYQPSMCQTPPKPPSVHERSTIPRSHAIRNNPSDSFVPTQSREASVDTRLDSGRPGNQRMEPVEPDSFDLPDTKEAHSDRKNTSGRHEKLCLRLAHPKSHALTPSETEHEKEGGAGEHDGQLMVQEGPNHLVLISPKTEQDSEIRTRESGEGEEYSIEEVHPSPSLDIEQDGDENPWDANDEDQCIGQAILYPPVSPALKQDRGGGPLDLDGPEVRCMREASPNSSASSPEIEQVWESRGKGSGKQEKTRMAEAQPSSVLPSPKIDLYWEVQQSRPKEPKGNQKTRGQRQRKSTIDQTIYSLSGITMMYATASQPRRQTQKDRAACVPMNGCSTPLEPLKERVVKKKISVRSLFNKKSPVDDMMEVAQMKDESLTEKTVKKKISFFGKSQ